MKQYIDFYNFINNKLNPKFLKPINIDIDISNDKLLIFKNDYKLSNLTENEILEYLENINIGNLSFYYGGDYTLNRLYKKLNKEEKKIFLNLIQALSFSSSQLEKQIKNVILNEFKFTSDIPSIIDEIIKTKKLTNKQICTLIDAYNYSYSFKENVHKYTKGVEKYLPNIFVPDYLMIFNPKISIPEPAEFYLEFKAYIEETKENSIYCKNIFKKINSNWLKRDKKRFLPNYTFDRKNFNGISLDPYIKSFDESLKIFSSTTFTPNLRYSTQDFIKHLFFLCYSSILISKNNEDLIILKNNILEKIPKNETIHKWGLNFITLLTSSDITVYTLINEIKILKTLLLNVEVESFLDEIYLFLKQKIPNFKIEKTDFINFIKLEITKSHEEHIEKVLTLVLKIIKMIKSFTDKKRLIFN